MNNMKKQAIFDKRNMLSNWIFAHMMVLDMATLRWICLVGIRNQCASILMYYHHHGNYDKIVDTLHCVSVCVPSCCQAGITWSCGIYALPWLSNPTNKCQLSIMLGSIFKSHLDATYTSFIYTLCCYRHTNTKPGSCTQIHNNLHNCFFLIIISFIS